MNKITITGHIGRDAVIKELESGTKILSFPVGVNAFWRGEKKTYWYDVSSFDVDKYSKASKHYKKGTSVCVIGDIDSDIEVGADGVTRCRRNIKADSIEFNITNSGTTASGESKVVSVTNATDGSDESAAPEMPRRGTTKKTVVQPEAESEKAEDDLPF